MLFLIIGCVVIGIGLGLLCGYWEIREWVGVGCFD